MLKIKKDKMQELEKFGFIKCKYISTHKPLYMTQIYMHYQLHINLIIDVADRIIKIDANCYDVTIDNLDIIYELIANDMVEKVDE